jgi:hypothetical protein
MCFLFRQELLQSSVGLFRDGSGMHILSVVGNRRETLTRRRWRRLKNFTPHNRL